MAGSEGKCTAVPDGTGCDDGSGCTPEDTCTAGECGGTEDCSAADTPCASGYCDEDARNCTVDVPAGKCVIGGECIDADTWHPEIPCLRCLPGKDATDWSAANGACYIDEVCHELGEAVGGTGRIHFTVATSPGVRGEG